MSSRAATISVRQSIADAYRLAWLNLGFLVKTGWPWIAAMIAAHTAVFIIVAADTDLFQGVSREILDYVRDIAQAFVKVALLTPLAIAWHCRIIDRSAESPRLFSAGRREFRFARVWFLMEAGFYTLFAPLIGAVDRLTGDNETPLVTAAMFAAVLVAVALMLVVSARLLLLLPAIAVGRQDASLSHAWLMSRGNSWRLAAGSLAMFLPALAVYVAVELLADGRVGLIYQRLMTDVGTAISELLLLAFYSVAFLKLWRDQN